MTYYMLRPAASDGAARPPMTGQEIEETTQAVLALEAEIKSAGAWVFGGRLHDPSTATVVRATGDDVMTTDGPFAETKDHLGGFYVLQADDLDGALAWASKVSALIRTSIEVRPFVAEMTS
ncbi:YciI family protein [Pseudonocardia nigra]|uniref:YciI family protein n=1 Tax=Pseudonocardia nigra TaxID=1921578 RepID=UPI001C5E61EE|nr:YciI family protein [Pseudonocardia nigra]